MSGYGNGLLIRVALAVAVSGIGAAQVRSGSDTCCDEKFRLSDVEAFAKREIPELTGDYHTIMVVPTGMRRHFTVATTSEESMEFCFDVAVRFRRNFSHAFLVKTPIGVGLHHWDAKAMVYSGRVISGVDLLTTPFELGRVAWVSPSPKGVPKLLLVAKEELSEEEARRFASDVLSRLKLRDAVLWIRTIPYCWPDFSSPYSLPLQWESPVPTIPKDFSNQTTSCSVDVDANRVRCFK